MPYLQINRFNGLNTNVDPRRAKPNKDDEGIADATEMLNMDITKEGSMVTSNGYSLVSSGAGVSGIRYLLNYDKNENDRYLIIANNDHYYSITPSSPTWVDLGDYGTYSDTIGGTIYNTEDGGSVLRKAFLGASGNNPSKTDSGAIQPVGGTPPQAVISAVFMGRLFVAFGTSVYYTDVEDIDTLDTSGANVIGFNDIVTGLVPTGERLIVLTRTYNQGIYFSYDDTFNLTVPLKEPYEKPYGCLSYKSVQPVASDAYYWSDRGILRLGTETGYDEQGIPRPNSLSTNIEASLEYTNKKYRDLASSVYFQKKQQYWLSVPYGTNEFPSLVFVWNENWKAWTTRDGFYVGGLDVFRNTDYEEELYFGDFFSPSLYKFDDSYSYDGADYTRRWKSKIFTMGTNIVLKQFNQIDITGSMDSATEFDVIINVDGKEKRYRVDNSMLIRNSFSDYIGDNWIGDSYLGGESPTEARFKRFSASIPIDRSLREGLEMQITIENNAAEQPFKIDFIGIDYVFLPKTQTRKYVNRQIST